MLIAVTSLGGDGRGLVEFTSPVGRTHAEWQGTEAPRRGAQYRVEIEIPDEVSLLQDPQPLAPTGLLADGTKGGVIVSGTVEGVGDDGVVSLRVGSDVLLLELAEVSLTPELAQTVSRSVPRIELYPYEL